MEIQDLPKKSHIFCPSFPHFQVPHVRLPGLLWVDPLPEETQGLIEATHLERGDALEKTGDIHRQFLEEVLTGVGFYVPMFHITQLQRGYFISNRYLKVMWNQSPKRDIYQPLFDVGKIYGAFGKSMGTSPGNLWKNLRNYRCFFRAETTWRIMLRL